eukprot:TRINITY_DN4129_c0_g1_i3.p1 TRINITY_DN4129_c0_g1~~TRINITY_DN4129_c0_g1_i3.p1  ORF type:complete len:268 (+),score=49.28 TRINITY_DN4129_c0_g1_i3:807-1610(+)
MSTGKVNVFTGLFVGASAYCAYLGSWQVQRHFWKADLIRQREELMQMDPVEIDNARLSDKGIREGRIRIDGSYLMEKTMLVGPRNDPNPKQKRSGHYVICPMVLADESLVLVNRGWIPRELSFKFLNSPDKVADLSLIFYANPVHAIGVFQAGDQKPAIFNETDVIGKDGAWLWLSEAGMKQIAQRNGKSYHQGVFRVIEEESNSGDNDLPFPVRFSADNVILASTGISPTIHLVYAATWFSLSGALLFLTRKWRRISLSGGNSRFR